MGASCLIVGYGSIGKRHESVLQQMGNRTFVVSGHHTEGGRFYATLDDALSEGPFDYIVIANRTCDHRENFDRILSFGYNGPLLIEKPVFDRAGDVYKDDMPNTFVGYNLRFDPVVQALFRECRDKKILSFHGYVGQYLPDWRPGIDYRRSYSASRNAGGGVLRDLSHELDYICRIAGRWKRVCAIAGRFSALSIDAEDVVGLLLETEHCPLITLQLNYLDRKSRREVIVNLQDRTLKADIAGQCLWVDRNQTHYPSDRDHAYRQMHQQILESGDVQDVCTFREGLETLELIEAAERSAVQNRWVCR
jgi:predicted dehydrogenase